jgi:hypothetical protein
MLICAIAADQHVLNMAKCCVALQTLLIGPTVLILKYEYENRKFFKIHYFHVLTSPLGKNIHPDAKTGLKSYVIYQNEINLSIELSVK